MCLILFAAGAHPAFPLIVAANRDEAYARPSAPVGFWADHPHVCAGRDLEHGGTWLGISTRVRFAAITNYRQGYRSPDSERSRGELTREFLTGTQGPAVYLRSVEQHAAAYNGFSLIVGNPSELWFYSNRGGGVEKITPGVHGLSNHLLDEPWPKVKRGIAELTSLLSAPEHELAGSLLELLGDRSPAPDHLLPSTGIDLERERALSASFIAGPTYGTRASTVLLVGHDGHATMYERRFGPAGVAAGESVLRFNIDVIAAAAPAKA